MKKIFLVLTLLVSGFGFSQQYNIVGSGINKCAVFLSDMELERSRAENLKTLYLVWSQGFITGFNVMGQETDSFKKQWNPTHQEIFYLLKRDCAKKPTNTIFEILFFLWLDNAE